MIEPVVLLARGKHIRLPLRWPICLLAIALAGLLACSGPATTPATVTTPPQSNPTQAAPPGPTATTASTITPGPTSLDVSDAVDLRNGRWEARASMPTARSELAVAVADGLIFVPGGYGGEATMEVYDPASDTWRSLATMPEGRHHLMAAAVEGQIYVMGGARPGRWDPTDSAWTYDPGSGSWSAIAPMPEPRVAGAAVAMQGQVFVVGGLGPTTNLLTYDPASNTWASRAPLGVAREHVAAVALDGRVYALAGRWPHQGEEPRWRCMTPPLTIGRRSPRWPKRAAD